MALVVIQICNEWKKKKNLLLQEPMRLFSGFQRLLLPVFRFLSSLYSEPRFSRGFGRRFPPAAAREKKRLDPG